jgi:hypothetical protein
MLRLAAVDVKRLGELVTDAWRMRAPDELVVELDEAEERRGAGDWLDLSSADSG